MFKKFRRRSLKPENLDKGSYTEEEYEGCLVELRRINEWLGDAQALRDSLLKEIEQRNLRSFSVLDVGAGSGELLRVTANWAHQTNRCALLVGLELNERSAQAILDHSTDFHEISSIRANGFQLPFGDNSFDYVIQSLTLHHFDDAGAINILREMARVAKSRIFVIDLNRNPVAYFFYTTLGHLFLHNRLIREDGALSILKSFTREELKKIAQQAGLAKARVEKHFPSRLVLTARTSSESRLEAAEFEDMAA
ncbi:MAG: methyltransferase domain-containing protein [Pyrinomonadaceae bacterium]